MTPSPHKLLALGASFLFLGLISAVTATIVPPFGTCQDMVDFGDSATVSEWGYLNTTQLLKVDMEAATEHVPDRCLNFYKIEHHTQFRWYRLRIPSSGSEVHITLERPSENIQHGDDVQIQLLKPTLLEDNRQCWSLECIFDQRSISNKAAIRYTYSKATLNTTYFLLLSTSNASWIPLNDPPISVKLDSGDAQVTCQYKTRFDTRCVPCTRVEGTPIEEDWWQTRCVDPCENCVTHESLGGEEQPQCYQQLEFFRYQDEPNNGTAMINERTRTTYRTKCYNLANSHQLCFQKVHKGSPGDTEWRPEGPEDLCPLTLDGRLCEFCASNSTWSPSAGPPPESDPCSESLQRLFGIWDVFNSVNGYDFLSFETCCAAGIIAQEEEVNGTTSASTNLSVTKVAEKSENNVAVVERKKCSSVIPNNPYFGETIGTGMASRSGEIQPKQNEEDDEIPSPAVEPNAGPTSLFEPTQQPKTADYLICNEKDIANVFASPILAFAVDDDGGGGGPANNDTNGTMLPGSDDDNDIDGTLLGPDDDNDTTTHACLVEDLAKDCPDSLVDQDKLVAECQEGTHGIKAAQCYMEYLCENHDQETVNQHKQCIDGECPLAKHLPPMDCSQYELESSSTGAEPSSAHALAGRCWAFLLAVAVAGLS